MVQQRDINVTEPSFNRYGDRFIPAGHSGHGGEISSQREDDLDRLALRQARDLAAASFRRVAAYDIGCGYGAMAMKFAAEGCVVVACDIEPMPALQEFARNTGKMRSEHIVTADASLVDWRAFPQPDIVYSQRFLHYLPFKEAAQLVQSATGRGDCSVYLSMSGLPSELGTNYPDAPLAFRFAHLSDEMARRHGIRQKVCLYGLDDARELAQRCGLKIIRLWLSDFGNIKMVAAR